MDKEELNRHAREIVGAIAKIDTDYRGDLLLEIADVLRDSAQYYTGNLFEAIGNAYNKGKTIDVS